MITVTHRCQWCDADYSCDTFVEGEDDHGRERSDCECIETDTCPLCSDYAVEPLEDDQ